MRQQWIVSMLALSFVGAPAFLGCDRKVAEEKTVKTNPETGKQTVDEKKTVQTPDGGTKTTEEHKTTNNP
jgi:hypothetical protein